MTPENKKSFILHADYERYYELLESDSERVKWTRTAFAYQNRNDNKLNELVKTMMPATRMFWEWTVANFERDNEKWLDKKEKEQARREYLREAKRKERGEKNKEKESSLSTVVNSGQQLSTAVNTDNVNVNNNDNININNKGKVKVTENANETANKKVGSDKSAQNLTNQEKLENFKKEFPKIVIDSKFQKKHDYDLLSKRIKESKTFLNDPTKKITLSLLLNNYEKIISGEWKDFSAFKKQYKNQAFKGRIYTADGLNALFDNIDEIEV